MSCHMGPFAGTAAEYLAAAKIAQNFKIAMHAPIIHPSPPPLAPSAQACSWYNTGENPCQYTKGDSIIRKLRYPIVTRV